MILIESIGDVPDDDYIENEKEISFDDWSEKYEVIKEIDWDRFDDELRVRLMEKDNFHTLWTMVESDGQMFIQPGHWYVNRMRYYITREAWEDPDICVIVD